MNDKKPIKLRVAEALQDDAYKKNARTGVSENVTIGKAEIKEASKVTVAPAQKGIRVQGDLKPGLLGRAVVKGDIVVLGGVQRRRDLMSDEFGDMNDIFGNLNEMFGGMGFGNLGGSIQQIRFIVVNTIPNKPCFISENTELILSNKSVEISEKKIPQVTYEDIGGLTDEVKKIREMVEVPLKHPEVFDFIS